MNHRFILIFVLLLAAGAYIYLFKPQPVLLDRPLKEFPMAVGDWKMVRKDTFSQAILDVLRPTDYLSRTYTDSARNIVTLYVGYHGGRKQDGGIHSPRNCLPGSGWFLDSHRLVPVEMQSGEDIEVVNSVMSKGTTTISFYYWFQVRGTVLTDEYSLKLAEVWNSLVAQRKDAAFVRISMNVRDGVDVDEVIHRFVRDFYPTVQSRLPS